MKCYSFFKVGGGFRAEDYQNIRHHTDGKWREFDPKRPPLDYIELGGKDYSQYERPDVWIMPCDSVVVEVKAASVAGSDQFRMGFTLRFPRFKKLRMDKNWETALDITEFFELKKRVEEEQKEKAFKVDTHRRATKKMKKELIIAGNEEVNTPYKGPTTKVFENLNFCILSEAKDQKKSKAELEQIVKSQGGNIFQNPSATDDMICVADKRVVKVASLMKSAKLNIVRPKWVFDTITQTEADVGRSSFLLPFEPEHMYFTTEKDVEGIKKNVDMFGDSFARDLSSNELKKLLDCINIDESDRNGSDRDRFLDELSLHHHPEFDNLEGYIFRGLRVFIDIDIPVDLKTAATLFELQEVKNLVSFAGGSVIADIEDETITHIVVVKGSTRLGVLRKMISKRRPVPRIATVDWIKDSWRNHTLLDAERYPSIGK